MIKYFLVRMGGTDAWITVALCSCSLLRGTGPWDPTHQELLVSVKRFMHFDADFCG